MGVAKGGEVLVSSTLRDAVSGSGFDFADHGTHRLKGIEGEWRLYEVTSVDGVRRSLPLTAEESRTRREFTEAVPVHRRRDRIAAGVVGGLVVALIATGIITNAMGADAPPPPGGDEPGLTAEERSLAEVVPAGLRGACGPATATLPDAVASIDCGHEPYEVTYSRFTALEEMQDRFDAFASGAPSVGGDCSTDASAVHGYTVNGIERGKVACYVDERASGLSAATSVIVWTDEESLVLARALRGDAADLTLYEWWRTDAGPVSSPAFPPKDGEAEMLSGVFELRIERGDEGTSGRADPSWAGTWTLTLSLERGFSGMPTYQEMGDLLFGKPHVLIFDYGSPFVGFGATCPAYQSVTWRERGGLVRFGDPVGHCRERNLDVLTFAPWSRIA
jgi:hypothetical protein